jgi:hypothetical protein
VIAALLASRILIQFVGQIATVIYLRSKANGRAPTYRMPLFPVPAVVALAGWLYVFSTSEPKILIYGVGSLVAGVIAYFVWDFARPPDDPESGAERSTLAAGPTAE